MTKLEQEQQELIREYERLITLSNSKEFFNIPVVNFHKERIASLRVEMNECDHENVNQKQIRCTVCDDCGEIIEIDV